MICLQGLHFDSPNLQDSFNLALFCGIHEKYAMWKFIVDVVNDFVSSLQPDVGRGFLHVSNVFLFYLLIDDVLVVHIVNLSLKFSFGLLWKIWSLLTIFLFGAMLRFCLFWYMCV